MKTITLPDVSRKDAILNFAKKNYNTYVAHYKARNMKPMSLTDFLKNYCS
ncbi:MAG: hypothetical protein ACWA42_03785 [Lutibacter sp.]